MVKLHWNDLIIFEMCGIVGSSEQGCVEQNTFVKDQLEKMKKRGPDAINIWNDNKLTLGHARLSIIDIDKRSDQPMISKCGNYVLVFNGEIYNYQSLRNDLLVDIPFNTNSDTEVLLNGLINFGKDFILECNGMFSFAFYNRITDKLLLARDRFGQKPLYYRLTSSGIRFGSRADLFSKSEGNKELCDDSVRDLLQLRYVPSDRTIYEGIRRCKPGTYMVYDLIQNEFIESKKYWEVQSSDKFSSYRAFKNQLRTVLYDSVRLRMIADVPVGLFISGGVDSTLIAAIASKILGSNELKGFNVAFRDKSHDESELASKVCKQLGIEFVSENFDASRVLPFMDDPVFDDSILPTLQVSELASRQVTVVLGGDGADEIFYGYNRYRHNRLKIIGFQLFSILFGSSRFKEIQWNIKTLLNPIEFLVSSWKFINPSLLKNSRANTQKIKDLRRWDITEYLPNDILKKIDWCTMEHSIEARSPFLDYRLYELVERLDPGQKKKWVYNKRVLKDILAEEGLEFLLNYKKRGFDIPQNDYLSQQIDLDSSNVFDGQRILTKYKKSKFKKYMSQAVLNVVMFNAWIKGLGK